MSKIFFAHPHTLLNQVGEVLNRVGPENFFTSPDEGVKKAREGFAAYFFTLTLKKYSGHDWWLAQYDQEERQFPDFDFISFAENVEDMKLESVELTGIYPSFKSFSEVIEVIEKKQKQYGNKPLGVSLLIFVNHEKSEEWINLLSTNPLSEHPFLSIWTIHLLFKKGGNEVVKAVAQRIRPFPVLRIEADTGDSEIHKRQVLPNYVEEKHDNGSSFITFKPDFIDRMTVFKRSFKNIKSTE